MRGGVEPHLVEVPGGGLIVEVEQGAADAYGDCGAGAARVLGGDLHVLVPDEPDHGQHRLLLPAGHGRSAHSVGCEPAAEPADADPDGAGLGVDVGRGEVPGGGLPVGGVPGGEVPIDGVIAGSLFCRRRDRPDPPPDRGLPGVRPFAALPASPRPRRTAGGWSRTSSVASVAVRRAAAAW